MPKTESQRIQTLRDLGLEPDADSLAAAFADTPISVPKATRTPVPTGLRFAPEGVDPHTMDVSQIEFTLDMLDGFPDLTGVNFKAASEFLFDQYRSRGRDRDRHALLHRRITEFISQVRRHRKSGGLIRERILAGAEAREMAQLFAARGGTFGDLAAYVESLEESA